MDEVPPRFPVQRGRVQADKELSGKKKVETESCAHKKPADQYGQTREDSHIFTQDFRQSQTNQSRAGHVPKIPFHVRNIFIRNKDLHKRAALRVLL
jgi:hypothetical protein